MSLKLVKALMGDTVEKSLTFGEQTVVFRTLTGREKDDVISGLPRADFTIVQLSKIPTLARSLVSINGVAIEAYEEVREALKKDSNTDLVRVVENILGTLDSHVIDGLYSLYSDFDKEAAVEREALKNSSRVQSADPSTKSATSSN